MKQMMFVFAEIIMHGYHVYIQKPELKRLQRQTGTLLKQHHTLS